MIYEYQCVNEDCKNKFELIISTYEGSEHTSCPKCGSIANKIMSSSKYRYRFNDK
jgi:putative FmdB family regulatory protein